MYESPVTVYYEDVYTRVEGDLLKTVVKLGFAVNEEELMKALNYDREQYQKGYKDGRGSVVRCRECTIKKAVPHKDGIAWRCPHRTNDVDMNGFCESGARMKRE